MASPDIEIATRLCSIRSVLGQHVTLDPETKRETVRRYHDPYIQNANSLLKDKVYRPIVLDTLSILKEEFQAADGEPTRRTLSGAFVSEMFNALFTKEALDKFTEKDIPGFVYWTDFAYGGITAIGPLMAAERQLMGQSEDYVNWAVNEPSVSQGLSVAQQAEIYMRLQGLAESRAASLTTDPKGIRMLENQLVALGKPDPTTNYPLMPGQIPDFVVLGAKHAVNMYKRTYPLTGAPLRRYRA